MGTRILYVSILASRARILYVGVTNNLGRRLGEHRNPSPGSRAFSAEHSTYSLVHYEEFDGPLAAIRREKQLKGWKRQRKIALIEALNPTWNDLSVEFGLDRPKAAPGLLGRRHAEPP
jgi:putative endonuclease